MTFTRDQDWRSEFERVYRGTAFAVHEHLRGLTRSPALAWDLTQETFLIYMRRLQQGRRVEKPLGFLYRVATRLAWRAMRRRRREPIPAADPPEQPVGPDSRNSEARLLLDKLWPLLGDHCRLVAKLWLSDGMGVADICSTSGFKRGRVRHARCPWETIFPSTWRRGSTSTPTSCPKGHTITPCSNW